MSSDEAPPAAPPSRLVNRLRVHAYQLLTLIVILASWQFLPLIPFLKQFHLFDSFFVSSPSRIVAMLADLMTGANGTFVIWPYIWPTVAAALIGVAVGMIIGSTLGLLLSNSVMLSEVFRPFVVAANAVPRIALIPIIILLVGPTFQASVVNSILVVFFVVFFNAFEGGRSVAPHLLQNAELLGASGRQVMLLVRAPYVLAWTLAVLPLAATFGIISVVTGEIFSGFRGLGRLVYTASATADSTLTFSVVIVLSIVGVIVVGIAEQFKQRVLHWWGRG
jgi:NitT/TauT family transport system permease protein